MNHLETLKWFDDFYNKNEKLVNIIITNDKTQMNEKEIPDIWSLVNEYLPPQLIKVYQIKGYTKFNWEELNKTGITLDFISKKGKLRTVNVYSSFYPGVRKLNDKQYLDDNALERLKEVFTRLMVDLLYYKKYKENDYE